MPASRQTARDNIKLILREEAEEDLRTGVVRPFLDAAFEALTIAHDLERIVAEHRKRRLA
jgi:hypothetical protein